MEEEPAYGYMTIMDPLTNKSTYIPLTREFEAFGCSPLCRIRLVGDSDASRPILPKHFVIYLHSGNFIKEPYVAARALGSECRLNGKLLEINQEFELKDQDEVDISGYQFRYVVHPIRVDQFIAYRESKYLEQSNTKMNKFLLTPDGRNFNFLQQNTPQSNGQ